MPLRLLFIISLLTAALLAATSCGGDAGQQPSNSSGNGGTTSIASTTEATSTAPEESTSVLESKDQEKSGNQAGKAGKGNVKACGAGRSGGGKVRTVKMIGLKYVPATVHISAGTTIRWVNEDTAKHTVSSEPSSGPLRSGEFGKGGSYEHTFEKPGSFDYYCKVHPSMTGTVIVR